MRQIPLWVPGLLGDVIYNLLGGSSVFLLGIYSYVSARTETEDRTFRFAFVGVVSVAIPILMNIAAGPLYLALGMTSIKSHKKYNNSLKYLVFFIYIFQTYLSFAS